MDGLWSSPDLVGLISLAVANRHALALSKGWWRVPARVSRTVGAPSQPQHQDRIEAQHHRPLRPGQRLLPALARRDHDLLQRGLRVARPVAGRCPAQQVPRHRGAGRARGRRARARDRHRLGWVRALRRRRAGLPRHDRDHLAGPARPGARSASARPGWTTSSPWSCATTATSAGQYDAVVSIEMLEAVGAEYYRDYFEAVSACAQARRQGQHPGHHLPARRLRGAAARSQLDPALHLPRRRAAVAGRHRVVAGRHGPAGHGRARHPRQLRADAQDLARALLRAHRRGPRHGLRRSLHPHVGLLPLASARPASARA